MTFSFRVFLCFTLVVLCGCGHAVMHTATPIEKGSVEVGIHPGIGDAALQARVGISNHLDVGARVAINSAFGADINAAIVNNDHWALSLSPQFSYEIPAEGYFGFANILLDLKRGSNTFTIAPRIGVGSGRWNSTAGGDLLFDIDGVLAGATLLARFNIGRWFALVPEVGYWTEVADNRDGQTNENSISALLGIVFRFGVDEPAAPDSRIDL